MSSSNIALIHVFESFANYGLTKQQAAATEITMDNARFAKLCRDAKIIGKNITTVDVDIVFKKVNSHCVYYT
jgi:hypothetical protein